VVVFEEELKELLKQTCSPHMLLLVVAASYTMANKNNNHLKMWEKPYITYKLIVYINQYST
jgi:hypothetical protein